MKPEHKRYILEHSNKKSVKKISKELNLKEEKIRKFLEKEKGKPAKPPQETGISIRPKTVFLSVALIIILGFTIYANSLNNEFIWDDRGLIGENAYIKNWSNISKIFTRDIGAGSARIYNFYRPLQMLSYMTDYSLWKLNVVGYHLTNISLHILVALCIWWLINILYNDKLLSLFTSVLFLVHPVHTEAVAYISGRADSLAAIFIISCLIFYIKYLHSKNISIYILMLSTYILALLSREGSLILPALLVLYHYVFKKDFKIKSFLPILSITFIYILLRATVLKTHLPHVASNTTLLERLPGFFVAITSYIRLLLVPFNLHMEYGSKLFKISNPQAILGMIALFGLLIYAFRIRKKDKLIFFSLSWCFLTLLPQSNLYPINAYMAEHWLYLPSIGFFLILSKGLSYLCRAEKRRILAIALVVCLSAFYSYLTIRQNNYWKEPVAFYERTLKYAPQSAKMHNNLADRYRAIGRREEAIALCKKAIELKPNYVVAFNNLGDIYRDIGENEKAIASYNKAIELNPRHAKAYSDLGIVYATMNKHKEAITLFKKAIEINPDYVGAYSNLGLAYINTGKMEEAIIFFKKAIAGNPNFVGAYNNLGNIYHNTGKKEEAIALYKKAIAINPNYVMAHINLSTTYSNKKQYNLAIKHCDRAIELGCKVDPKFLRHLEKYRK